MMGRRSRLPVKDGMVTLTLSQDVIWLLGMDPAVWLGEFAGRRAAAGDGAGENPDPVRPGQPAAGSGERESPRRKRHGFPVLPGQEQLRFTGGCGTGADLKGGNSPGVPELPCGEPGDGSDSGVPERG